MKKQFLMLMILGWAGLASAAGAQFDIPAKEAHHVKSLIATALLKETGFKQLEGLQVDLSPAATECLAVESEMNPDAAMGVCIVSVSAYQVEAKVSVVKKSNGSYVVTPIYADVD